MNPELAKVADERDAMRAELTELQERHRKYVDQTHLGI